MKSVKFAVVALIVAVAIVGTAHADNFQTKKKLVNISFTEALHTPGLPAAMYAQLDETMIKNELEVYSLRVNFAGTVYRITGTYDQWRRFFDRPWQKVKSEVNFKVGLR